MNTSTEVAAHNGLLDVTRSAATAFAEEQKQLIRRTIAPEATDAEFQLLLDFSSRYQLNPLAGELWLARMPSKDGGPPKFTLIVGRDGFLKIANRHADYRGHGGDVVRAYDHFHVKHTGSGVEVDHQWTLGLEDDDDAGAAKDIADERMARKRGKIIGAWALVHREGRASTFFYAPWGEYAPKTIARSWKTNPSAMIFKCALANALRLAYSLSGLYADAEMEHVLAVGPEPEDEGVQYGDDELGAKIAALVQRVNEVKPGSHRPAKVAATINGASDYERTAYATELERQIVQAGGELPDAPEEVHEAEIVE